VAVSAFVGREGKIDWIKPPSINDVAKTLAAFADHSSLLLVLFLGAAIAAIAIAIVHRRFWPDGFVATWLLLPLALTFLVSYLKPMFVSYYLIICLPAFILLSASAVMRLHETRLRAVLVAAMLGLSVFQLSQFYRRERGENWREATRFVLSSARDGDAIVFYPAWSHKAFDYYQRQDRLAAPSEITSLEGVECKRVWLMIRKSDADANPTEIQGARSSLTASRHLIDRRQFHRVGVELYAR